MLAASALVLTAAALDSPSAARALGLLLLLLCGALSAWHWGPRRRTLPADRSSHDCKPGEIGAAGTPHHALHGLTRGSRMRMRPGCHGAGGWGCLDMGNSRRHSCLVTTPAVKRHLLSTHEHVSFMRMPLRLPVRIICMPQTVRCTITKLCPRLISELRAQTRWSRGIWCLAT